MIEFEWDAANIAHLKRHRVTPEEFEQAMLNDPLELFAEDVQGEARFHYVGMAGSGRLLYLISTERSGRVRAVTAFAAPYPAKQAWKENR